MVMIFFSFVFNRFYGGLVIALLILNTLKEDIMKGFMEMFEDIMVAITFAEADVSVSFLRQNDNLYRGVEVQAWDLK